MSADTVAAPPAQLDTNEIPPTWRRATLGELVERLYSGGTPSTQEASYWSGSTPWITGADIVGQKVAPVRRYVTPDAMLKGLTQVVPKGGVLIVTRTGVGKVAVAPFDVAVSQDITGAVPKPNRITGGYLYWWLIHNANQLTRLNQGTSINGVVRGDLATLQVLVPPLEEQQRITEVLSSVEAAIEGTDVVINATERLRQALAHDFLTRGVPGWHHEWKQVPSIGILPSCWRVARLDDVAQVQTGRAVGKPVNHSQHLMTLPYLSVANVKDGYMDLSSVKMMKVTSEEVRRFSLKPGDVLFTEGGDADKLGRGCVWGGEIDPCLHQNHVFAVRPEPGVLRPQFLALFARSKAGKAYFLKCSKQTTNLASINSTQLKEFRLPVPSLEEQDAILAVLGSVPHSDQIIQGLRRLKAALAEELLNGRVRVPEQEPRLAASRVQ